MIVAWLLISFLVIAGIALLIPWWISIYNQFQYLFTRAEQQFANINAVIQQRFDNLVALAQVVKNYDTHEYGTMKDVIKERNTLTKDLSLFDNTYAKVRAIIEKYPDLKADQLHVALMHKNSEIEQGLCQTRHEFNQIVQQYNEQTRQFPYNIVASVHNFMELNYLVFEKRVPYKPTELFSEN